jgi:hypothetical protein
MLRQARSLSLLTCLQRLVVHPDSPAAPGCIHWLGLRASGDRIQCCPNPTRAAPLTWPRQVGTIGNGGKHNPLTREGAQSVCSTTRLVTDGDQLADRIAWGRIRMGRLAVQAGGDQEIRDDGPGSLSQDVRLNGGAGLTGHPIRDPRTGRIKLSAGILLKR